MREHSCPTCGYTVDWDENAAWNVLQRGIKKADIGMGCAESTPSETAVPTDTEFSTVSANRVIEQESPTLKRSPRCKRMLAL